MMFVVMPWFTNYKKNQNSTDLKNKYSSRLTAIAYLPWCSVIIFHLIFKKQFIKLFETYWMDFVLCEVY